jgi:hypothetical protein
MSALLLLASAAALFLQVETTTSRLPLLHTEGATSQREARGKMFNFSGELLPLKLSSGEKHFVATHVSTATTPELPVAHSDLVALGEVVASDVYLSPNGRSLYTEYTVTLERVIQSTSSITSGDDIPIVRLGGVARLTTGGILRQIVNGYGPELRLGSKYLLFLKHVGPPADVFTIVKFWILENGGLLPAFEDDSERVRKGKSSVSRKPITDVLKMD